MESRIESVVNGKKPEEIEELVIDECKSSEITGLTDKFCSLKSLKLNNVGLSSLKEFPKLLKLEKLELDNNDISEGLEHLEECINLKFLSLKGNKISSLDVLKPLANLKNLKTLQLEGNDVASISDYREDVLVLLPGLESLDGRDMKNGTLGECSNGEKLIEDEGLADEDEDDDDDDDEEEDDEDEVGLSYLQKSNIDEESEGDDYEPEDKEVDSDVNVDDDLAEDDDSEDEEEDQPKEKKRKVEEEE